MRISKEKASTSCSVDLAFNTPPQLWDWDWPIKSLYRMSSMSFNLWPQRINALRIMRSIQPGWTLQGCKRQWLCSIRPQWATAEIKVSAILDQNSFSEFVANFYTVLLSTGLYLHSWTSDIASLTMMKGSEGLSLRVICRSLLHSKKGRCLRIFPSIKIEYRGGCNPLKIVM